ncbi:hypothetical protein CBL_05539 [Carabus blaptoides fortunei]
MQPRDRTSIDSDRSLVEFRLRSLVKNVGFLAQWTLKFEFSGFPDRRGCDPCSFYISFSIFHLSEMMATAASQNRRPAKHEALAATLEISRPSEELVVSGSWAVRTVWSAVAVTQHGFGPVIKVTGSSPPPSPRCLGYRTTLVSISGPEVWGLFVQRSAVNTLAWTRRSPSGVDSPT